MNTVTTGGTKQIKFFIIFFFTNKCIKRMTILRLIFIIYISYYPQLHGIVNLIQIQQGGLEIVLLSWRTFPLTDLHSAEHLCTGVTTQIWFFSFLLLFFFSKNFVKTIKIYRKIFNKRNVYRNLYLFIYNTKMNIFPLEVRHGFGQARCPSLSDCQLPLYRFFWPKPKENFNFLCLVT